MLEIQSNKSLGLPGVTEARGGQLVESPGLDVLD